jgi:hypothetical protein
MLSIAVIIVCGVVAHALHDLDNRIAALELKSGRES